MRESARPKSLKNYFGLFTFTSYFLPLGKSQRKLALEFGSYF